MFDLSKLEEDVGSTARFTTPSLNLYLPVHLFGGTGLNGLDV